MSSDVSFQNGYADINGLRMYYEMYGEGDLPLVLIHGGGSTIQTTFGNIIPYMAKNRKIIAMELQAHGRTNDRNAPLSFQQDADDIAALLLYLQINIADFIGFSNGGQTLIELALRHPGVINKMIICSAFYKREAVSEAFWNGFDNVHLAMMPKALRNGFLAVNNHQEALQNSFDKDVQRMKHFKGWSDEQIQSIKKPTLIIHGNNDVGSIEHTVKMYRTMPNAGLVILPGVHGEYLGATEALENNIWLQTYTVGIVETFLNK